MKAEADRNAVEQAVERQPARRDIGARGMSAPFLAAFAQDEAIEEEIGKKAESNAARELGARIDLAKLHRLWQQIEEGDPDHGAGAETEDQVQPILETEGEEAAQHGGNECAQANQNDDEIHQGDLIRLRRERKPRVIAGNPCRGMIRSSKSADPSSLRYYNTLPFKPLIFACFMA